MIFQKPLEAEKTRFPLNLTDRDTDIRTDGHQYL